MVDNQLSYFESLDEIQKYNDLSLYFSLVNTGIHQEYNKKKDVDILKIMTSDLYRSLSQYKKHQDKQIKELQNKFDERLLTVENYLLDQETQKNISTLSKFNCNFKTFNSKYTLPYLYINKNNITKLLNLIHTNNELVFFIVIINDQKYLYSNYRCALEYFYPNDFKKLDNFFTLFNLKDFRSNYYSINININKAADTFYHFYNNDITLYFTQNNKTYKTIIKNIEKQNLLEVLKISINNNDVTEITEEQKNYEILSYNLSQQILNNLPTLKYGKKETHKIDNNTIVFTNFKNDDSCIYDSLIIYKNKKEIFNGNSYSKYIQLNESYIKNIDILKQILNLTQR